MARRRFAVALIAPPVEAAEIDTLRRAVGLVEPFHVAPHVTLVPPVNVAEEDLADVKAQAHLGCDSQACQQRLLIRCY